MPSLEFVVGMSECVASNIWAPFAVNGGTFFTSSSMPLLPHTPDRSRGLKAWPSTLYVLFAAANCLLLVQRGQVFHPGPGVNSVSDLLSVVARPKPSRCWANPAKGNSSVAAPSIERKIGFLMCWYNSGSMTRVGEGWERESCRQQLSRPTWLFS